jgi:hypothetical protein
MRTRVEQVSSGQSPRIVKCVLWRPHDEVSDNTMRQELLRLCDENSSGIQKGERLPWEAGTRGIVRDSRPRRLSACIMNYRQSVDCVIAIGYRM